MNFTPCTFAFLSLTFTLCSFLRNILLSWNCILVLTFGCGLAPSSHFKISFEPVGKKPFLSKSDLSKLIPLDKRNVGDPHPLVSSDVDVAADVEFDSEVIKCGFFRAFLSFRRFRFSCFRFCLSVISKSQIKGIT